MPSSSSNNCLQYYYPTEELKNKYKINCSKKFFADFENYKMFNNENFLKFVQENYGDSVFNGDSPFSFKGDYINLTNEQLCKTTEYSLKPQQKFAGQFINPNTNINSTLIFHGLGSGKTCTSLVIGEAFKSNKSKLLYVVPAPLVNQYRDEILGELKMYSDEEIQAGKEHQIWSCTSQCEINGKRDFYTNINDRLLLDFYKKNYEEKKEKLKELTGKQFSLMQNEVDKAFSLYNSFKERLISMVSKTFQIESHIVFLNKLFEKTKDGTWTKKEHLKNKDSILLNSSGILVIDEIQRLVSESGIFYNKLYTAIYQYIHPKCRIVLLTATPIYDNPYELSLTMNLLRPRIPFPLSKEKFYSFFLGKYDKNDDIIRVKSNNFINEDSTIINKDLLKILSAGYVSYFRGGNPNAYPYKRIIVLEHKMAPFQKTEYINALKSDIKKDSSIYSKLLKGDEFLFKDNLEEFDSNKKEDSISGIYVTTQQFSNIALPINKSDVIENILSKDSKLKIKGSIEKFKNELKLRKALDSDSVLDFIREKGYSEKFVNIIDLSLKCTGPVFIFSNWLQFGVESLSVILDACGFNKFPDTPGNSGLRYFIWNSETSINKDLIQRAKSTFNSMENKDGSRLKIILGTRSIMEGVSFKNVKQVHITDPWWNEARIEQIMARAVRFCSHSNLPLEEQYVDIFRHYSVLPMIPDLELTDMLNEVTGNKSFKKFDTLTIEQKMITSALKKYQINKEFEETLKQVSYDCDINTKGNIIRLEENIIPFKDGKFTIYYKNSNTLELFMREGIPEQLTLEQILNREYSFPNNKTLPVKFYEIEIESDEIIKIINEDTNEPNILQEPDIDLNLNFYENVECWNSNLTLEKIFDELSLNEENKDIISYFMKIKQNFELYPILREKILGEKYIGNKIQFRSPENIIKGKKILSKCLQSLSESTLTPTRQKIELKKLLKSAEAKDKLNSKIIDIVYNYRYLPENMIEELQNLDANTLNELVKEAKNYHSGL